MLAFNTISVLFLFAISAAGVVPSGGPKKSPYTSSIVQIMFSFWSFEISEGILRNQKFIIGINHGFQCSNIRWITRKVFEHLPSDPANV